MAMAKYERSRCKRKLKFLTKHQGNPLSQARLTESDSRNGVVVTIELDGQVRSLSLNSSQMTAVEWYAFAHLKMDRNNEVAEKQPDGNLRLRRSVETFADFEHFQAFIAREKKTAGIHRKQFRTDEGDPVTEHHERLIELLAYAILPVWAKDENAFVKRWGITSGDHCFRAMLARTEQRETHQHRRAA